MESHQALKLCKFLGITITKHHEKRSQLQGLCPLHDEQRTSFGFNYQDDKWNCLAGCGGGNIPSLIKRVKGYDHSKLPKIYKRFGITSGLFGEMPSYEDIKKSGIRKTVKLNEEMALKNFTEDIPKYFYERGFGKTEWKHWNLKYNKTRNSIVFPVYTEDKVFQGWGERFIDGIGDNRYAQFLPKKDAIYGEWLTKGTKWVVVVEGYLDAIRLRHLVKGKIDVVALIGLSVQKWQMEWIKGRYDNIVVMMDNDKMGIKKQSYVVHLLKGAYIVEFPYIDLIEVKDVCDYRPTDFLDLLYGCTKVSL